MYFTRQNFVYVSIFKIMFHLLFLISLDLNICIYRDSTDDCPANHQKIHIRNNTFVEKTDFKSVNKFRCVFLTSMTSRYDRLFDDVYFTNNLTVLNLIGKNSMKSITFESIFTINSYLSVTLENISVKTNSELVHYITCILVNSEIQSDSSFTLSSQSVFIDAYSAQFINTIRANDLDFTPMYDGNYFKSSILLAPLLESLSVKIDVKCKNVNIKQQFHEISVRFNNCEFSFIPIKPSVQIAFNYHEEDTVITMSSSITSKSLQKLFMNMELNTKTTIVLPDSIWAMSDQISPINVYSFAPLTINVSTDIIPFQLSCNSSLTMNINYPFFSYLPMFFSNSNIILNYYGNNITMSTILFETMITINSCVYSNAKEIDFKTITLQNSSLTGPTIYNIQEIRSFQYFNKISNFGLARQTDINFITELNLSTLQIDNFVHPENEFLFKLTTDKDHFTDILIGPDTIKNVNIQIESEFDGEYKKIFVKKNNLTYLSLEKSDKPISKRMYCLSESKDECTDGYLPVEYNEIDFNDYSTPISLKIINIDFRINIGDFLNDLNIMSRVALSINLTKAKKLTLKALHVSFLNDNLTVDTLNLESATVYDLKYVIADNLYIDKMSKIDCDISNVKTTYCTIVPKKISVDDYSIYVDNQAYNATSPFIITIPDTILLDLEIQGSKCKYLSIKNDNPDSTVFIQSNVETKESLQLEWSGVVAFTIVQHAVPINLKLHYARIFIPSDLDPTNPYNLNISKLTLEKQTTLAEKISFMTDVLAITNEGTLKNSDTVKTNVFYANGSGQNVAKVGTNNIQVYENAMTQFKLSNNEKIDINVHYLLDSIPYVIIDMLSNNSGSVHLIDMDDEVYDFVKVPDSFQLDVICSQNLTCDNWNFDIKGRNFEDFASKMFGVKCTKSITDPSMTCISMGNVKTYKMPVWLIVIISISVLISVIFLFVLIYYVIFYVKRNFEMKMLVVQHTLLEHIEIPISDVYEDTE